MINKDNQSLSSSIKNKIVGRPRNIHDPTIFHKISLIALLSWIGLGADGLSSSAYGPEEAFKAIGEHTYLAVFLAIATACTVFIISYSYSKIIEQFPHGGGGYIVASHTLGKGPGVISGSALLVDYVLTITVSIAACGDAIFSFLSPEFQAYKLLFKFVLVFILIILNIRGVKESVIVLAPIFLLFLVTHIVLLGYGLVVNIPNIQNQVMDFNQGITTDIASIGVLGILALFVRAFSFGSGTYTGIEAVSNGLPIMREPRVKTAKKTMLFMAVSLSLVAGLLLICFYFNNTQHVAGKTLNAVLANNLFGGLPFGYYIAFIIILSEALLLIVAAQTGFIDGPRVMANMAKDTWLPKRFAALSERLTMHNGVLVMGLSAAVLMVITDGAISILITMYAINVFLTFSLSEFGMTRWSLKNRGKRPRWKKELSIFLIGFVVCFMILTITIFSKFREGGWFTLLITSAVIFICFLIHRHYATTQKAMKQFDEVLLLSNLHLADKPTNSPVNPIKPTAVLLVNDYTGFGVNTFLSLIKNFPQSYANIIFISVAEIDSGTFKGIEEVDALERYVKASLIKYVDLARRLGYPADYRMDIGTDVVDSAVGLCKSIAEEFPNSTFFTGRAIFRNETLFYKLLHNETPLAIQRRLQWNGFTTVILPIRVEIKSRTQV